MKFSLLIGFILFGQILFVNFSVCHGAEDNEDTEEQQKTVNESIGAPPADEDKDSKANSSTGYDVKGLSAYFTENKDMFKRGFYVLLAVTGIVVIYFGIRLYRSKKRSKVKSYGLLSSNGEHFELNPLDSDSEDDYTVFEAKTIH